MMKVWQKHEQILAVLKICTKIQTIYFILAENAKQFSQRETRNAGRIVAKASNNKWQQEQKEESPTLAQC